MSSPDDARPAPFALGAPAGPGVRWSPSPAPPPGSAQRWRRAWPRDPDVGKVVGHRRPPRPASTGVTWRVLDVRDPALAGRLGKVDTVVHLAVDTTPSTATGAAQRRARNVRGTQTVLTAAAAAGVRRVVLVHVGDGLRRAARQPGAARRGRAAARGARRRRSSPTCSRSSGWRAQAPRTPSRPAGHRAAPGDGGRARHRQRADPALRGAAAAGRARLARRAGSSATSTTWSSALELAALGR